MMQSRLIRHGGGHDRIDRNQTAPRRRDLPFSVKRLAVVAQFRAKRRIAFWIGRLMMEDRTVAAEQQRLKSIFDEAAEIASLEDRAAYLERACGGDADL